MNDEHILLRAANVLETESKAIRHLITRLDQSFVTAVKDIVSCKGKIVTTGVGKAGIIAHKVAATLSSTGSPSLYLHPAEAVHGDLGVVSADDLVLAFSNSGESDEVVRLLPTISAIGAKLIAVVGNVSSTLGKSAKVTLNIRVDSEACPLGLAPTASTIAMLAIGDALAMSAMEHRGFTKEDYALRHPAGALGKRLTLRVSDIMRTGDGMAIAGESATLEEATFAITRAGAGAVCIVDADGILVGLITDGDIRRAIQRDRNVLDRKACEIMIAGPMLIIGNPLAAEALGLLEEAPKKIGEAPVVDSDGRPVGLLMLKDLLRSGIV